MNRRRGFTLIELVVTLGVLTVVLGAVFFTVSRRDSSRREIEMAGYQLLSDIRYARQRAIMDGERVQIVFDGANDRYIIRYHTYTVCNNPIKVVYLPDNVWFVHSRSNRVYHFRPRGTPSSGFTIQLRTEHHRLTLTVVPSGGRVRIYQIVEVN